MRPQVNLHKHFHTTYLTLFTAKKKSQSKNVMCKHPQSLIYYVQYIRWDKLKGHSLVEARTFPQKFNYLQGVNGLT